MKKLVLNIRNLIQVDHFGFSFRLSRLKRERERERYETIKQRQHREYLKVTLHYVHIQSRNEFCTSITRKHLQNEAILGAADY
jgi:hypothetical protein